VLLGLNVKPQRSVSKLSLKGRSDSDRRKAPHHPLFSPCELRLTRVVLGVQFALGVIALGCWQAWQ